MTCDDVARAVCTAFAGFIHVSHPLPLGLRSMETFRLFQNHRGTKTEPKEWRVGYNKAKHITFSNLWLRRLHYVDFRSKKYILQAEVYFCPDTDEN